MNFRVGDFVEVRTGRFAGQGGWVVRVTARKVTVRLRRAGQWYHVAYSAGSLTLLRAVGL